MATGSSMKELYSFLESQPLPTAESTSVQGGGASPNAAAPTGPTGATFDWLASNAPAPALEAEVATEQQIRDAEYREKADAQKQALLDQGLKPLADQIRDAKSSKYRARHVHDRAMRGSGKDKSLKNMRKEIADEKIRADDIMKRAHEVMDAYSPAREKIKEDVALAELEAEQAYQAASKKASARLVVIDEKLTSLRAQDPSKPIMSSTWGIAAALIGALRQGLFGGENTAMAFLNKKIDYAAKLQIRNIKSLGDRQSRASELIKTLKTEADSESALLENMKTAMLKEVKGNYETQMENFKIEMDESQSLNAAEAFHELNSDLYDKMVSEDRNVIDVDLKTAEITVEAVSQMTALEKEFSQPGTPTATQLGVSKEIAKQTREDVEVMKGVGSLMNIIKGANLTDDWVSRLKSQGAKVLPELLLSTDASGSNVVSARIALLIFKELAKTQGKKITDKDWALAKPFIPGSTSSREGMAKEISRMYDGSSFRLTANYQRGADTSIFMNNKTGMVAFASNIPTPEEAKRLGIYDTFKDVYAGMRKLKYSTSPDIYTEETKKLPSMFPNKPDTAGSIFGRAVDWGIDKGVKFFAGDSDDGQQGSDD